MTQPVALITGASRGIGEVTTRLLAARGHSQQPQARYVVGRDATRLLLAKRVLNDHLFDGLLRRLYKVS